MPTVTRHQDRRSGNIFSGIVSQSSATNAWYVGRYFGNNNKNNGNNYAPFSAYAINAKSMTMKEYVKIEDVNDAYMDCRRTKRNFFWSVIRTIYVSGCGRVSSIKKI